MEKLSSSCHESATDLTDINSRPKQTVNATNVCKKENKEPGSYKFFGRRWSLLVVVADLEERSEKGQES